MCSKVLNGHIILTDTSITTILAPEMTYTPKLPTYSPALVLNTTQIPIIPWIVTPKGERGRYMTRREAAKLQCMDDLHEIPDTIAKAFRAFGNAVNVEVVKRIADNLIPEDKR